LILEAPDRGKRPSLPHRIRSRDVIPNILDLSFAYGLARYAKKAFPYGINESFSGLLRSQIKDTAWAGFDENSGRTSHQHSDRCVALAAMNAKSERHTNVEIN